MSRFVEILHQSRTRISLESLNTILADMKEILGARSSHIESRFLFHHKTVPQCRGRA